MSGTSSAVSRVLGGIALAAVALVNPLDAQAPASRDFEIRPYVGAFLPTGEQRDLLKDALLVGAQASYSVIPQLAITGTLGWSPTEDRVGAGQTLDLLQYDVGAELRAPAWAFSSALHFPQPPYLHAMMLPKTMCKPPNPMASRRLAGATSASSPSTKNNPPMIGTTRTDAMPPAMIPAP